MYLYAVEVGNKIQKVIALLPPEQVKGIKLASQCILGSLKNNGFEDDDINLGNFYPNPTFINFLHGVIAKYGTQVSSLSAQAQKQEKGWVYIIDARCPDPQGRVLPEDIIGAFEVVNGKITSDSYKKNDKHLIFSEKGFFKLQSTLNKYLIQESLKLLEKGG